MNISKINQSIQAFCTAAGLQFGGKQRTESNIATTANFIWTEYTEWFNETNQTAAAKELLDIAYFALSECWQYGYVLPQLPESVTSKDSLPNKITDLIASIEKAQTQVAPIRIYTLLLEIKKLVEAMNFDFQKCFDAVQESNMSKFLTSPCDADMALVQCEGAKDENGNWKYKALEIAKNGGLYCIKDSASGKVVKEHSFYHKADLSGCVKLK